MTHPGDHAFRGAVSKVAVQSSCSAVCTHVRDERER